MLEEALRGKYAALPGIVATAKPTPRWVRFDESQYLAGS
jgi:hypothetical protein